MILCVEFKLERLMMSSVISFAQYENLNISGTKEDFTNRKTPFFFLKGLLNEAKLLFTAWAHAVKSNTVYTIKLYYDSVTKSNNLLLPTNSTFLSLYHSTIKTSLPWQQ